MASIREKKPKARTWKQQFTVKSFTNRTDEYTISEKLDGTWACSCKAWIFQRKKFPNGHCKHIEAVLAHLAVKAGHALEESARKLLDMWAVEEVTALPDLGMTMFEDRSV
jgi:hypothetical protein